MGEDEIPEAGRDWSAAEVGMIVADYFAMLRDDLAGRTYSKAAHNRSLREALGGRSRASVEFKHRNISAALVDLGLPYLGGYRPAANYQRVALPAAIAAYLEAHPGLYDELAASPVLDPAEAREVPAGDVSGLFEEPPGRTDVAPDPGKPWLSLRGRKVDFARRDAENRRLGRMGERFAVEVERRWLAGLGRDDLAAKVAWVADEIGDGVGFDVLSYDADDEAEWYIEVKTTGLGKFFPFLVTANEVRCSEDQPDRFHLYRLFDFARGPRLYVVRGALSSACCLEPVRYVARLGPPSGVRAI